MQIIAQLFSNKTFQRSEPFQIERSELASDLEKLAPEVLETTVVIIIMEKPRESEEFQYTLAPLFRADDYVNYFGANQNGREKVHTAT